MSEKASTQPFSFGSQVVRFNKLEKEGPVSTEQSVKSKKQSRIEEVVESRLKKMKVF